MTQETAESLLQNALLSNEQDPIMLFLYGTEFVGRNSSTDFPPENAHGEGEITFLSSMPKHLNKAGEKSCSWGEGGCLDSIELYGISMCIDQSGFACTANGDCAQIRAGTDQHFCTDQTVCTGERMHRENWDCTEKRKCMSVMKSVYRAEWVCPENEGAHVSVRVHRSECFSFIAGGSDSFNFNFDSSIFLLTHW